LPFIGNNIPDLKEYCQAQPQFQLSWAELVLVLIPPAARPAVGPPGIVVNKQEISLTCFVFNIVRSILVKFSKAGRRPSGKTTSIEDEF
jgi:hypothetical protein